MQSVHTWSYRNRSPAHPDVRGVDVARVVLFGGHQLHTRVIVGQDVLEAVPVAVLGCLSDGALTVGPLLGHLLVLSEHHPLLHALLQYLTLQETHRHEALLIQNRLQHANSECRCVWEHSLVSQNSPSKMSISILAAAPH